MTREDIMSAITELAYSQGFYGRLLRAFNYYKNEDPDTYDEIMNELEDQKFGSTLDLVLYLET